MKKNAIGLIETQGLVAAVEAADACLKAANVVLTSFRFTTGGLVCVTVSGDVGAVRASIDAGSAAAGRIGKVVGVHVIPRPADDTTKIIEKIDADTGNTKGDGMSLKELDVKDSVFREGDIEQFYMDEELEEDAEQELEDEEKEEKEDEVDTYYSAEEFRIAADKLRKILNDTQENLSLEEGKGLDDHGVKILRRILRTLPIEGFDKSQISTMRKKALLDVLMDFIAREGGTDLSDES